MRDLPLAVGGSSYKTSFRVTVIGQDGGMRVGFGARDQQLVDVLAATKPATSEDVRWRTAGHTLRMSAYCRPFPAVPERYVLSVRCFIRVGDALIVCENADGTHVWPGGRRESGETVAQTAVREVYEETGWVVDTESIRQVGLLHYHHLTPVAADHPYPHPDFCQLVIAAEASRHASNPDTWTDTDGWEQRARLVPLVDLARLSLTAAERFFVDHVM